MKTKVDPDKRKQEDVYWNRRKTDFPLAMYITLAFVLLAIGFAIGEMFH